MSVLTALADMLDPAVSKWDSPGQLAVEFEPKTVTTPALEYIDAALVEAANTPDSRVIINMPPQEGKSVRAALDFPVWLLTRNPELRIVMATYGQALSTRNGRKIRERITRHGAALGLKISRDNGAVNDWTLEGHEGGVLSVGVGGSLTGRPADVLIIDDPFKNHKDASSPTQRENVWDWWTGAAASRLSPGAIVIVIQTRWHEDDLTGRLLKNDAHAGWNVINIPAQADHRPENGETDLLGREPGEFMVSARGRTREQWESRKATAGPKTWAALYQGRPSPLDGGVFPKDWPRYETPLWRDTGNGRMDVPGVGAREDHELIQSWDLAFKGTQASDYVVGQVWLRIGAEVWLLDQVRERLTFTQTVEAIRRMSSKWPQATAKFIEDKANGPAVIDSLKSTVGGIIPVNPEGSKEARANAIAPFCFAGNVHLPDSSLLPNVGELLEETKSFPASPNDDTVDAMSQALKELLLRPLPVEPEPTVFWDDYDSDEISLDPFY